MSIRGICKFSVLAVLVLAVFGCGRPNLIGTDSAVYSGGRLYAVTSSDLNSVYAATEKALEQLEVEVVETAKDVFYAKVVGKIADGRSITIRMEPGANDITNISIKASKFLTGNKERANAIYEKIKENLEAGSGK